MFEHLKDFNFILVTGPQRSGTTIAARMIAEDTGKQFLPEGAMVVADKIEEARDALPILIDTLRNDSMYGSVVIQCPIQCRYIHALAHSDTLIIMMHRPVADIIASEQRIDWHDTFQRGLYADALPNGPRTAISTIKYRYWTQYQRHYIIENGGALLDVWYDELHQHPLWIPKEQRKDFGPRQIGPDEDYSYFEAMV